MQPLSVGFTTNPLDRLNNHRHDEPFLKSLLESPQTVFLPFKALKPLLHTANKISKPYADKSIVMILKVLSSVWLSRETVQAVLMKNTATLVLLGSLEGKPHYALDFSKV